MNSLKKNKLLIGVFVVVTLIFVWNMFSGGSKTPTTSILSSAAQSANTVADQDIIRLLLDMRSIQLDGSVFGSPAFILLRDFSRDIVPEPRGRENPFLPVSGSAPSAEDSSVFGF